MRLVMTTDRDQAPVQGGPDPGFAGPLNSEPPPPRRPSRKLLIGGVAAAVAAGLAFGLLARPDLGDEGVARLPMKPVERPAAAEPAERFEIEINRPTLDPVPKVTGKLEVLPPDLARAAEARVPQPAPRPPAATPTSERQAGSVAAPEPAPVIRPPEPRYARPSFDCRSARSQAEEMVCADPQLAAADRRLARAYGRAVAAGVPPRALRAEQDDWLAIRDDAARYSAAAVASVYDQRISELEELAEEGY
jgi:uncharacterized protein YecT (DUF1311 family)